MQNAVLLCMQFRCADVNRKKTSPLIGIMRWQHTKVETLSEEQVESHIREWISSAEKMEKMTPSEAKRFIGAKRPDPGVYSRMDANMQHKIRKEAPSKDAEDKMMEAWQRRMRAYYSVLSMLNSGATSPPTTTITTSLVDSGKSPLLITIFHVYTMLQLVFCARIIMYVFCCMSYCDPSCLFVGWLVGVFVR